jgi:hypothetical protein
MNGSPEVPSRGRIVAQGACLGVIGGALLGELILLVILTVALVGGL